jgi:hypothetical protein
MFQCIKVKEFYNLQNISGEAFFIRDDFTNAASTNKASNGGGPGSKSIYYIPAVTRELFAGDYDGTR